MTGLTGNMRGAVLMTASMAAFTLNDTCLKALSDELPLMQAMFLRGIATTGLIALFAWYQGDLKVLPRGRDRGLILLRTLAEVGAAYFFLTALFNMPIANVTAILQVIPLAVTLAGAAFLGEAVGWRRMSAIVIGFAGVLLIVRPGTDGFDTYSLYALIAVAFVTVRDLSARRLSAGVPSILVAFMASLAVTLFAGASSAFTEWHPVNPLAAGQLALASVFIVGGYLFSVMVMRVGDIGTIAPFRYSGLLWALVLGLIFFDEWPDKLTLLGSAIVVATGIFTLLRERSKTRAAPVPLRTR